MRARLLSTLALLLAAGAPQAQVKLNEITSVSVKDEGTRIAVMIQGSRPPNFTTFSMADPPRFVIDLSESRFQGVPPDIDVGDGFVNVIKNLSYGSELTSIARVMVAFAVEVDPPETPDTVGNTLIVRFPKPAGPAAVARAEESNRRAKEEAEAKARAELEAKARAEADAKARADAEAKATAMAAEKVRAEQDAAAATARADQERRARELADARVQEEAAAQAAAEARAKEIKARADLAQGGGAKPADDDKLQERTPAVSRADQERLAKEQAAAEKRAEAEKKAQELADAKAKADEERRAKESERIAKLDAERQAREQAAAEKKAAAENDRLAREQAAAEKKSAAEQAAAEKKAAAEQAAAEKKAAAEQAAAEKRSAAEQVAAEKKAEADRKKQEVADAKARAEEDRKARAEQARLEREAARTAASDRLSSSAPIARLKEIGFKQLPGTTRVYVRTDVTPRFTIQDVGEDIVRVEFENTRVARRNDTRFMDTSFFQSAVALITPSKKGDSYVVDIKLKQRVPYQQKVEGDLLAIDFERPPGAAAPAGTEPVADEPAAAEPGSEPAAEPPVGGPLK
jgi:colicin import membrane protein